MVIHDSGHIFFLQKPFEMMCENIYLLVFYISFYKTRNERRGTFSLDIRLNFLILKAKRAKHITLTACNV